MSPEGLVAVIELLQAAYHITFDDDATQAWAVVLAGLSDDRGKRAAVLACRKLSRLPTPAAILTYAEELGTHPADMPALSAPTHDPAVAVFWMEVIREIQKMPSRMFPDLPLAKAGDLKTIQAYDAVAARWREKGQQVPAPPVWMEEFRVP